MAVTLIFAISIAVPLGVVAASKAGTWIDRTIRKFAVLGFSVPIFVVGYLLAHVFALEFDWLPVQGYISLRDPGNHTHVFSAADYINMRERKLAYVARTASFLEDWDYLLTPAASVAAFPVERVRPPHWPEHAWDRLVWAEFLYPFSMSGHPAASIPCGMTSADFQSACRS